MKVKDLLHPKLMETVILKDKTKGVVVGYDLVNGRRFVEIRVGGSYSCFINPEDIVDIL